MLASVQTSSKQKKVMFVEGYRQQLTVLTLQYQSFYLPQIQPEDIIYQ